LAPRYDNSAISLARQAVSIRKYCDDFSYKFRRSELTVNATIQPTPLTNKYRFRLKYKLKNIPKLWITEPKLISRCEGEKIPHMYSQERPCVFHPPSDWNSRRYLGTTVIPWLAEWLFFYEIWYATGEWLGGGIHPSDSETEEHDYEYRR